MAASARPAAPRRRPRRSVRSRRTTQSRGSPAQRESVVRPGPRRCPSRPPPGYPSGRRPSRPPAPPPGRRRGPARPVRVRTGEWRRALARWWPGRRLPRPAQARVARSKSSAPSGRSPKPTTKPSRTRNSGPIQPRPKARLRKKAMPSRTDPPPTTARIRPGPMLASRPSASKRGSSTPGDAPAGAEAGRACDEAGLGWIVGGAVGNEDRNNRP
jgi:hypothetical protein